jgi:hypothetical protein
MSSPISSNMGLTARNPESRDFGLVGKTGIPDVRYFDVRSLGVGHFVFSSLGARR